VTSDEINALPPRVREYIMWLSTDADPAGTIAENWRLTQENRQLRRLLQGAEATFHQRIRRVLSKRQQGIVMGAFRDILGIGAGNAQHS
jgi:hypothetical protein